MKNGLLRIAAAAALFTVITTWLYMNDPLDDASLHKEPNRTAEIVATIDAAGEKWRVEGMLYLYQNAERGAGFLGVRQFAQHTDASTKRTRRVLVLGDSYTYGAGLIDTDLRWTYQLEDILNEDTVEWEVATLALGGASTFTHADLLDHMQTGNWDEISPDVAQAKERLGALPDVLVLGFVANDVLPGLLDGVAPDYELETNVLRGDAENPYATKWMQSLREIAALPVEKKYVVLLDFADPGRQYAASLQPVFKELGFEIVDRVEVSNRVADLAIDDLIVNPGDAHPGPAMHRAYAVDVARALLGSNVPTTASAASATPTKGISNIMPVASEVRTAEGASTVRLFDANDLVRSCGNDTPPCMRNGEAFVVAGEPLYPRTYPCTAIDAAHSYIGLRGLRAVKVWAERKDGGAVWVVPVVLDTLGRLRDMRPVKVSENNPTQIDYQGLKGLRVVQNRTGGCAEPLVFVETSVQLQWK